MSPDYSNLKLRTRGIIYIYCGGMPESRNSGLNSEEPFPRQWNETIASVARQRLGERLSATVNLGFGGKEDASHRCVENRETERFDEVSSGPSG
jgi:hypothetical protein